jgi:hypothetical protein
MCMRLRWKLKKCANGDETHLGNQLSKIGMIEKIVCRHQSQYVLGNFSAINGVPNKIARIRQTSHQNP